MAAASPDEIAARMALATEILKDPLGYWRDFSSEPRSVTSGYALDEYSIRNKVK